MKKILSIILVITITLSFSACGKESAEKYCFSCGEGIPKNATFCEHCGTKINFEKTESTTDNSGTSQTTSVTSNAISTTTSKSTQTNTSNKVVQNSKPVTTTSKAPTHTHSYSKKVTAATCTAQGYTIHTCSCGDSYKDSYTNPAHSFSNYKCLGCGIIDKENIYGYLCNWISANGKKDDKYFEICFTTNDYNYSMVYDAQEKQVIFTTYIESGNYGFYFAILMDDIAPSYFYYYDCEDLRYNKSAANIVGFIDSKSFNSNTKLAYTSFESEMGLNMANGELDMIRDSFVLMLYSVDDALTGKKSSIVNSGLTIRDLGFEALS